MQQGGVLENAMLSEWGQMQSGTWKTWKMENVPDK